MANRARPEPGQPTLVTGARASRTDEIAGRQRRYMITMLVRTVAFVAAVVFFVAGLETVGIVLIALTLLSPLVAIVLANGGPPPATDESPQFYADQGQAGVPRLEDGRTIDADHR